PRVLLSAVSARSLTQQPVPDPRNHFILRHLDVQLHVGQYHTTILLSIAVRVHRYRKQQSCTVRKIDRAVRCRQARSGTTERSRLRAAAERNDDRLPRAGRLFIMQNRDGDIRSRFVPVPCIRFDGPLTPRAVRVHEIARHTFAEQRKQALQHRPHVAARVAANIDDPAADLITAHITDALRDASGETVRVRAAECGYLNEPESLMDATRARLSTRSLDGSPERILRHLCHARHVRHRRYESTVLLAEI